MKTAARQTLKGLVLFGGAVAAAALIGGLFNPGSGKTREWYQQLDKPAFVPPDWVFGPAWTTLYVLIALSGYRVWKAEASRERTLALRIWTTQILLNGLWSPIFFGAKRPGLAFVCISLMLVSIVAFIVVGRKADKRAAWMFVPYLAWVVFAAAINAEVVRLNPR